MDQRPGVEIHTDRYPLVERIAPDRYRLTFEDARAGVDLTGAQMRALINRAIAASQPDDTDEPDKEQTR
jgi:hypothetical protein